MHSWIKAGHFPNGMMGQVHIEKNKSFMKYALDSVFFFQGEIVSFFGGFGISECMGRYPFILREDDGSEGKIDPRFGFTVFLGR